MSNVEGKTEMTCLPLYIGHSLFNIGHWRCPVESLAPYKLSGRSLGTSQQLRQDKKTGEAPILPCRPPRLIPCTETHRAMLRSGDPGRHLEPPRPTGRP